MIEQGLNIKDKDKNKVKEFCSLHSVEWSDNIYESTTGGIVGEVKDVVKVMEYVNELKKKYMKKVKIVGLDENGVDILMTFLSSKLTDENYINVIEGGGNHCNMDWMEDGMDISGDDMIHELFNIYGDTQEGSNYDFYTLKIGNNIFTTIKSGENWLNEYTMKYEDKTKPFKVKLESLDPTGVVIKSEELSMVIEDDHDSMINNHRLFIHIGECLYRIDKKGFIIERIIPKDNSN